MTLSLWHGLLLGLWLSLCLGLLSTPASARRDGPPRTQTIDMVVIHSTGGPTCDARTGAPIWVRAGTLAANLRFIEAFGTDETRDKP